MKRKLSADERRRQLESIASIPDEAIDTSDIPELTEEAFSRSVRGRFYRPLKKPVTMRLDVDVVDWLKSSGRGYQTKVNRLLRSEMTRTFSADLTAGSLRREATGSFRHIDFKFPSLEKHGELNNCARKAEFIEKQGCFFANAS